MPRAGLTGDQPPASRRDRVTWVAYGLLGWFTYLQAAPGLVALHLRDELHLGSAVAGPHVAAFAGGSTVAGLAAGSLERVLGRCRLLWSGAALMGAGAFELTAGRDVAVTVGSVVANGLGGGLLLVTVRALHAGWRVALLVALPVPASVWWGNRRLPVSTPPPPPGSRGELTRAFRVAVAVLFCTTAAEWCTSAWGASFVEQAADVSPDTAVSLMAGYFGGVVAGRVLAGRLARSYDPARLLGYALAVTAVGFAVLWPSNAPGPALVGLSLLGIGLGNLFPTGVSLAVSVARGQAGAASGRAVAVTSSAVLLAPVTVGVLADATSLRAALSTVPVAVLLAAVGLVLVRRVRA